MSNQSQKVKDIMRKKYPSQRDKAMTYLMKEYQVSVSHSEAMVNIENFDLPKGDFFDLLLCCYQEARGEKQTGVNAVASVVMNRLYQDKEYFGYTLKEIVYKNNGVVWQFEGMQPKLLNHLSLDTLDNEGLGNIFIPTFNAYFNNFRVIQDKRCCYYKRTDAQFGEWAERLQLYKVIGSHDFWVDPELSS